MQHQQVLFHMLTVLFALCVRVHIIRARECRMRCCKRQQQQGPRRRRLRSLADQVRAYSEAYQHSIFVEPSLIDIKRLRLLADQVRAYSETYPHNIYGATCLHNTKRLRLPADQFSAYNGISICTDNLPAQQQLIMLARTLDVHRTYGLACVQ